MKEEKMDRAKRMLFVVGGVFAAGVGMLFSKQGFGIEVPEYAWIGWGLGLLCFVVQIAFSSQLAYKDYNYVIFIGGIMAYVYSGWSNFAGIRAINPEGNWWFALLLGEFLDWIAEPLIVYGLIGVSATAQGDFLRNLFGIRPEEATRGRTMAGANSANDAAQRKQRDMEERSRIQRQREEQQRKFPPATKTPGTGRTQQTSFQDRPERFLSGAPAAPRRNVASEMDLDEFDQIPESAYQQVRRLQRG